MLLVLWYGGSYTFVHTACALTTAKRKRDKARRGIKYAKLSENEGQEKGWLKHIDYEGREVCVQWHAVP